MRKATSEARRPARGLAGSGGFAASLLHNAGDHLSSIQQGLRGQMGVTLAKKALDHVKRDTPVHQEAGERVAQIMEAHVS